MLHYAVVFFVIALISAVFGFTGIAAGAAGIAKILFVVFLLMAVVSWNLVTPPQPVSASASAAPMRAWARARRWLLCIVLLLLMRGDGPLAAARLAGCAKTHSNWLRARPASGW